MLNKKLLLSKLSVAIVIGLALLAFGINVFHTRGAGNYPSMVMYNDKLYMETDTQEKIYSYVYVGEIESVIDAEQPVKNLQANDNLIGCKIYVPLNRNDYIFVYHEGMYIPYKDVNLDGNSSEEINDKKYYGSEYLENQSKKEFTLLSDPTYSNVYGGQYLDSKNQQTVVLLTEINNEIISKFESVIGNNVRYEKCNAPMKEIFAIHSYIVNYWESPALSDASISKLMDSMASVGIYDDKNVVFVQMVDCTDKKIALFKEKIIDSEYILFENVSGLMVLE